MALADRAQDRLADVWADLHPGSALPSVSLTGPADLLPARLPVLDTAVATVAAALLAAARLRALRDGGTPAAVSLDTGHAAAAVTSERHLRVDGLAPGSGFAPLSRFWPAADGWVRTHGNYPWHRAALLQALGVAEAGEVDAQVAAVAEAIAVRTASDVEDSVVAAGGVAAAVRTADEWRASPPGRAAALRPLVDLEPIGDAPARRSAAAPLPAAGVRVLDLTRVIAGPVATRMLAALGAEVLRIDPPQRPELPLHVLDGMVGKRSALLDASTREGRTRLHELVDAADVVVCGYRPHALDRLGLHPQGVAHEHPGVVLAVLSAWGDTGPWGERRGFDSLVQAATGIAVVESADDERIGARPGARPGALPCQLLDHGTGYLMAAGILTALARQRTDGGTYGVWLSLARTAQWLLDGPGAAEAAPTEPVEGERSQGQIDPGPWLQEVGTMTAVAPPGLLGGRPLRWPGPAPAYGSSPAAW